MRRRYLFRRLFILFLFTLTACQSTEEFPSKIMIKPGDNIHGMTLTKGTADAAPLWVFCSSPEQNDQMITAECQIPLSTKLAIGQFFSPLDKTLTDLDWSKFTWNLSIDGQSLDLDAFGTYNYALPAQSHPPCPIREVFIKSTSWDIVLSELKPGRYTLQALAQAETGAYIWLINLVIEPPEKL
jgi:hypothetical protein